MGSDHTVFKQGINLVNKVRYVGCLLVLDKNILVLQKRDNAPEVSHPNSVSVFGGRVHDSENRMEAMSRELREELGLEIDSADLRYLGFLEHYDTLKGHMVSATYYWLNLTSEPEECNEGRILLMSVSQALECETLGDVTREMIHRYSASYSGV